MPNSFFIPEKSQLLNAVTMPPSFVISVTSAIPVQLFGMAHFPICDYLCRV